MTATLDAPAKVVRFQARGAIGQLMRCRADEALVEGPAGTGKSRGILEYVNWCADQYPGVRVLLARKTRASMSQSVLVTWEDHVHAGGHESLNGSSRHHRSTYKYRNGSEVVVAGLDDPERIKSTEFDVVYINEATEVTLNDWEMVVGRLRNGKMPWQQAIADCNPDTPMHWLNRRADAGMMQRLLSRHRDNPRYFTVDGQRTAEGDGYLKKLDRLTGVRGLRLRDGKWAAAEGVVYDTYDPATHLIDRFDIPDEWERIRCIDFGYTNPFTCQWWALDGDRRMYLYREVYGTRRLVEDWAATINKLSAGETYASTIADHDAGDRATLDKYGIHTVAAHKPVKTGIELVQSRMRIEDDGRPRIMLLRDTLHQADQDLLDDRKPTCLIEELPGYAYPPGRDGKPNREEPIKDGDHGCDAMRYAVAWADGNRVYIGGLGDDAAPERSPVVDEYFDDEDTDQW